MAKTEEENKARKRGVLRREGFTTTH